jgi:hypothetical protein
MNNPVLMQSLCNAVKASRELEWLHSTFNYNSQVPLNETPIINFRNYRYKIVEIFVMSFKQEKAVLEVEIATADTLVLLGTYAEYRIMDKLINLNDYISSSSHSWNKLLLLSKGNVRLLVNMAFAIMHLFAGDIVPLSDNEIVYCYILAAAVVSTINKSCLARIDRDIQKSGLKRTQFSISDRSKSMFNASNKIPKESSKVESSYVEIFTDLISNNSGNGMGSGGRRFANMKNNYGMTDVASISTDCTSTNTSASFGGMYDEETKFQQSQTEIFEAAAKRLSVRKSCLQSLAGQGKDLPQIGRLLHLGRTQDTEPNQIFYYVGHKECAMPASNLGVHLYKKSDLRSVHRRNNTRW